MKTSWVVGIIIVLILAGGGWYWWSMHQNASLMPSASQTQTSSDMGSMPMASTTSATTTTATTAGTPIVTVANDSTLGNYLVAQNGMTLYLFTQDTSGVSNCNGTCASTWPPYRVAAGTQLAAGSGIAGVLGTITRSDGTLQVTYNSTPLYFYVRDMKPGDSNGSGVGNSWFVVHP